MLLFDSGTVDDSNWKTERLEFEAQKIVTTLKSGNSFKLGNAIGAGLGTLGLIVAGGGVVSPFIGLLLATGALSSVVAYGCYCIDESENLGVNPLWLPLLGGEESAVLSEILTDSERSHWELIRLFGATKVRKIEEAGLLDVLIDSVQDIDLGDVDDRERMRIYSQSLKAIKESVKLFPSPTTGFDRPSPRANRNLPASPTPDIWEDSPEDNPRTVDRYLQPTALADSFDWSTITRRPHLFVLGDSGSGKTSLVQWLVTTHYPKTSEVLVLDPHDVKGQWGEFPTIGRGRNFDAIELALENLVKEMDKRYASGTYDHPPQIVIIEEIPAIAANCKNAMSSIASLTLEARKVKIFLIVLSQGWEVDSLGLRGKGSVRDSFCFISLGQFAVKKAKEFGISSQIKGVDRPCFVGDDLATVPELNGYVLAKQPDIRSSLDRLYQSATAPEPIAKKQYTPAAKSALASPMKEIFEYAKTQETVKARDIQNNVTGCKKIPPDEIRSMFLELEEFEYGYTEGEGSQLSFSTYS